MRKFLALFLIVCLIPLAGCTTEEKTISDKILITATLFPQYDFARVIGGDKVDVTLLLPPGTDSHHFDPSPSDMVKISESNLFIYTGDAMEGWAGDIAASLSGKVTVLNVSEGIELSSSHEGHDHAIDPHIWLDFDNAIKMCENITNALCTLSPENADYFISNFDEYSTLLSDLDKEYQLLFQTPPEKDLVFGGRFAVGYLVKRYNIPHQSAYESCNANDEPGARVIAALCDYVKENDVKVVYCEEFSDGKVAKEIAKANNAEVLVLHSCHNTSREEREAGETFISLMEQNLENIRKGLN